MFGTAMLRTSTSTENVLWLTDSGFNVFMLEYRGYGKSHGEPTLPGVLADVDAGFTALLRRQDVDRQRIAIYGQSLGGALAVIGCDTAYRPARACGRERFELPRDYYREACTFWLTWPFQWMPQLTVTRNTVRCRLSKRRTNPAPRHSR
jgi:hypothetical protein